ncbi:EcsC family protein [Methylobacter sp. S3L5C]|uniref:EcsC family protein n=1 Tax=Methylobacter sp. S3L5C TaxID=2839024 RepID=UPI001FAE55E3|nr:EcsC family protein [Methylobacter sp. S3L5C]
MRQVDFIELVDAAQSLETMSLATRMSQLVRLPVEKAMTALPGPWSNIVGRITKLALKKALGSALLSLTAAPGEPANKTHQMLAGLSGALGGSFGITALAIELPISATIMMRSIADIARSQGEDLDELDTRMACLSVFALSGGGSGAESADTGYYAMRSFLTKALNDTANHVAALGLSQEGAPALVKLLSAVSTRFSIPVSQKLVAQAIPAIGLISGASVNLLFMNHYQKMAKAHFTVRRLERRYGEALIKQAYTEIVISIAENKNNVALKRIN